MNAPTTIMAYNVKLKRKEMMKVEGRKQLPNGTFVLTGKGIKSGDNMARIVAK